MISVIASITLNPGSRDAFIEAFKANVPHVLAEEGCIEYFPAVDVATGLPPQVMDDNMVTVIEKWESVDDLRAHAGAPHMLAHRERTKGLVASMSLKVLEAA